MTSLSLMLSQGSIDNLFKKIGITDHPQVLIWLFVLSIVYIVITTTIVGGHLGNLNSYLNP